MNTYARWSNMLEIVDEQRLCKRSKEGVGEEMRHETYQSDLEKVQTVGRVNH